MDEVCLSCKSSSWLGGEEVVLSLYKTASGILGRQMERTKDIEAIEGVDARVTVLVSTLYAKTMPKAISAINVWMLDCIKIFRLPTLSTTKIPINVPKTCSDQIRV